MSINLLISCGIYLFGEGIRTMVEENKNINVIGIACNDLDLMQMMAYEPDIVIADDRSCQSVFEAFEKGESAKMLLITDAADPFLAHGGLQAMVAKGLAGIMTKNADSQMLEKAIQKVYGGDLWIDHKTIKKSISTPTSGPENIKLTRKEAEILHYLCSGYSNKETARRMSISVQTVKSHCNNLYKKFGVSSRLKLVLQATDRSSRPFH
ncbi:DNA-binding response regulator [Desulfuromonas versatilis]|uniref:DNA-binding response regulator n=1 Tax=Desulfuromonas versatilis TaxID=2802975 RepID=A0ABN6DYQ9_9BACT|nr:response regulator transcription factor [Desulfuromonas versatilis]BCR05258.1 DNA-binding response regulator [Desulfuromonas versatilis]